MPKNTNSATDYIEAMRQSFETMGAKMEIPGAAREMVRSGVSKASEGLDTVESGLNSAGASADKITATAIDGYRSFSRELFDAGFANMRLALDGLTKLAEARTFAEAMQIQTEIMREGAQSNMDRARKQAEMVRDVMTENTRTAQEEAAKLGRKAA